MTPAKPTNYNQRKPTEHWICILNAALSRLPLPKSRYLSLSCFKHVYNRMFLLNWLILLQRYHSVRRVRSSEYGLLVSSLVTQTANIHELFFPLTQPSYHGALSGS